MQTPGSLIFIRPIYSVAGFFSKAVTYCLGGSWRYGRVLVNWSWSWWPIEKQLLQQEDMKYNRGRTMIKQLNPQAIEWQYQSSTLCIKEKVHLAIRNTKWNPVPVREWYSEHGAEPCIKDIRCLKGKSFLLHDMSEVQGRGNVKKVAFTKLRFVGFHRSSISKLVRLK